MSKLTFNPVRIAAPFKSLAPVEVWEAMAASRLGLSNLGNFATTPERPHDRRSIEIDVAAADIREAIRSGEIPAYVYNETTAEFFTIPRDYWADGVFVDFFVGRVFALKAEELVLPSLDGQPIVVLEHEWLKWLEKVRAADAEWMTINRAERELKQFPLNGRPHLDRLFDALESGDVKSVARLPAPRHDNPARQGRLDPDTQWWRTYLAEQSTTTPEWTNWFLHGGLAVFAADIRRLLAKIRILGVRFKSDKTRQRSDRSWDVLECWGWIATRSLDAVASIGEWLDSDQNPGMAMTCAYCELRYIVSNNFCSCGKSDVDNLAEPWRGCGCTNDAWDEMCRCLVDGQIAAFRPDQTGELRAVPPTAFLNARHLPQSDGYEMLGGATDILVDRNQIKRFWPATQSGSGAKNDAADRLETAEIAPHKAPKVKRGPAPDEKWPDAIREVAAKVKAANYTIPLKRGQKTAIAMKLVNWFNDPEGGPSKASAMKYAAHVIALLPNASVNSVPYNSA